MIKSPEKQYNAYRILKVLSNQDYLAVDYTSSYFILSPIKNRYNVRPKSRSNQYFHHEIANILKHRECIELDRIHYYVFPIGQHEVTCANNFDLAKIKNAEQLFQFFTGAIKEILKHLLLRDAKEVRKFIDVRNAIIVKGHLYLLELDRGKLYPRSMEKSERLLNRFDEKDSFRQLLENQLKIMRYFGLFMWEIIYRCPYLQKNQQNQKFQENLTRKLIQSMISKHITYEYLCIRIREEEGKVTSSKDKKPKKLNFLIKKETSTRYKTESMNSDKKRPLSKISTESFTKYATPSDVPWYARKRRIISEINTGEESIQTFHHRIPKFKQQLKWTNTYKSSAADNMSIRDSESKISVGVYEKLMKQSQVAKTMFKKFVDIKFNLKHEKEQQVNETLRSKLLSKIQRFKTEHKSHSREKQSIYSLSQKNVFSHLESYETYQPVTKKLEFCTSPKTPPIIVPESNLVSPKILAQTNTQQVNQNLHQPKQISAKMDDKKIMFDQKSKSEKEGSAIDSEQFKGEQISFQVINFQNVIPLKNASQGCQTPIQIASPHEQSAKKTIETIEEKKQAKNILDDQNTVKQKEKENEFLKRKKLISEQKEDDEIEVITIKKTTTGPQTIKSAIKQSPPSHPPRKPQINKGDELQTSIAEYESLITILGDIATRAVRARDHLSVVIWQKPVYFLYQRFIFERDRFLEALLLGARQIIRKHRVVDDDQWDVWLQSDHRKQLITKIQSQNKLLKEMFITFAAKVVTECEFERKIDFFIRNRQKIANIQGKTRKILSKLAAKYSIEMYNTIQEENLGGQALLNFLTDCLYGCLIMAQLDSRLQDPKQRVQISNYQRYSQDLKAIESSEQLLYSIYFLEDEQEQ